MLMLRALCRYNWCTYNNDGVLALNNQDNLSESRLDDICREATGLMTGIGRSSHVLVEDHLETSISLTSVAVMDEFAENFLPSDMPNLFVVHAVKAEG